MCKLRGIGFGLRKGQWVVIRAIQHVMTVLFLLSFTNQAVDAAGKAIWPIRFIVFILAAFAMYFSKKCSVDMVGETAIKTKSTWLIAGGIVIAALILAMIGVYF